MRNLIYFLLAALALAALSICQDCGFAGRVMAAEESGVVKGDLVIDFLGAQRGYVEPCG